MHTLSLARTRSALTVAALTVGLLSGIGASAQSAAATAPPVRTVTLSNSGQTVAVTKGGQLRIDLKTIVDAGDSWARTKTTAPSIMKLVSRTMAPYAHKPGTAGFPYHTYYLLKAVGFGTTSIKLREKSASSSVAVRHFSLTIHVVPYIAKYTLTSTGAHVTLARGHSLRLDLKTDSDGGYYWSRTHRSDPDIVGLTSKKVVPYSHPTGVVGFPYHSYYLLKAVNHGTTTIKLAEHRSSFHSTVARFSLTITVPRN